MLRSVFAGAEYMALPLVDLHGERRQERSRTRLRSHRNVAIIIAVLIAGPFCLTPLTLDVAQSRTQLGRAQAQLQAIDSRTASLGEVSQTSDAQVAQWSRLAASQLARRSWQNTLLTFGQAVPIGVTINQLQISQQGDGSSVLVAQGTAGSMAQIDGMLDRLDALPSFAQLHLDEASLGDVTSGAGLTFKITGPLSGLTSTKTATSGS
jgi:Tfp pilus assembly protein PilN